MVGFFFKKPIDKREQIKNICAPATSFVEGVAAQMPLLAGVCFYQFPLFCWMRRPE